MPWHYDLDIETGAFTQINRHLSGGTDWALMQGGDAPTTPTLVEYFIGYTGWADFCPDGSYASSGWGGTSFNISGFPDGGGYSGTTSPFYLREVFGTDSLPGGDLLLLTGFILDPCQV